MTQYQCVMYSQYLIQGKDSSNSKLTVSSMKAKAFSWIKLFYSHSHKNENQSSTVGIETG